MPDTVIRSGESFVGIRRAAAIAHRSPTAILRLALLGKVRVQLERGEYPRYAADDCSALRGDQ